MFFLQIQFLESLPVPMHLFQDRPAQEKAVYSVCFFFRINVPEAVRVNYPADIINICQCGAYVGRVEIIGEKTV